MTVHSCSYYCTRPECILSQRNELRDKMFKHLIHNTQKTEMDRRLERIQEFLISQESLGALADDVAAKLIERMKK